jgi:CRISPR-associated protein (TIGR02584 family)
MLQPSEYPRRILLVVIGMTPQIVTETLFKLALASQPVFVPSEIHLITTEEGADSAKLALLGVGSVNLGWLDLFKQDYKLPEIQFSVDNIHIIADTEGQFINDSESSEHNRIASDFITRKVKEFTDGDDSALHVSLAGGRKTMSFYAGYALSLYGRQQDRLSHVLVDQAFQNNPDFFYPRPEPQSLQVGNRFYNTHDAKIVLSDIPFVRLQQHIPTALLNGDEGFQATVEKIENLSQAPKVILNIEQKSLFINDISVRLTPFEFALYYWFCQRTLSAKQAVYFSKNNHLPEFMQVLAQLYGVNSDIYEKAEAANVYSQALDQTGAPRLEHQKAYLSPHRTRLHKTFKQTLGERFAKPFLIKADGKDVSLNYRLNLPASAISII